ncbi:MAG: MBL fold metallo-hydrolase [Planctomycetota bacterium]|nr:MAG: MBL fold metallo-hydrolase [Planctomycetota bacterium]
MAQSTASVRAAEGGARVSRRGFLATAGCVAGTVALSPTALARAAASGRLGAGTYFPRVEVGKGVHAAIDLSSGGNVMVVSGRDAALMVDTKYPAFAAALQREASTFGGPVTHVLNTHHHADHTGGNGVLKGRVEVLMGAREGGGADRRAGRSVCRVGAGRAAAGGHGAGRRRRGLGGSAGGARGVGVVGPGRCGAGCDAVGRARGAVDRRRRDRGAPFRGGAHGQRCDRAGGGGERDPHGGYVLPRVAPVL